MVISILGCGWFGKALGKSLTENGHTVKGSVTTQDKFAQLLACNIKPYLVRFEPNNATYPPEFFECDVLVISIPPKFRQGEANTYPGKIQEIINAIIQNKVAKVIYISSTKVYGDNNTGVSELNEPMPDTEQGLTLLEAERIFRSQNVFKTTVIRFAGLVGPNRHPGNFFAGKKDILNGKAPVNLIHLTDCVGITTTVIEKDAFGSVLNACSPNHPAKMDFYTAATLQAGFTAPVFIDELKSWKMIESVYVAGLLNYEFKVPVWEEANFNG
jgi:nucleoside-diphosphate-sugar epimerase